MSYTDSTSYAIVKMSFEDGKVIWAKELAYYDSYGQINLHYTHDIKGDPLDSQKLYISSLFRHSNETNYVGNSVLWTENTDLEARFSSYVSDGTSDYVAGESKFGNNQYLYSTHLAYDGSNNARIILVI